MPRVFAHSGQSAGKPEVGANRMVETELLGAPSGGPRLGGPARRERQQFQGVWDSSVVTLRLLEDVSTSVEIYILILQFGFLPVISFRLNDNGCTGPGFLGRGIISFVEPKAVPADSVPDSMFAHTWLPGEVKGWIGFHLFIRARVLQSTREGGGAR
jgi:hypothetical protein